MTKKENRKKKNILRQGFAIIFLTNISWKLLHVFIFYFFIQSLFIGPMLMLSFISPLRYKFASINWKLLHVCFLFIPFLPIGPVMILCFISSLRHKFASINWKLLHFCLFVFNFIYSIPIHRACDDSLLHFPFKAQVCKHQLKTAAWLYFVIISLLSIRPMMILSFISPLRHRFSVIAVTQVTRFLFV